MITTKKIGVLAGGISAEREVSLKSGKAIYKALLGRGYNAVFIDAAEDLHASITSQKVEIVFIALHGGQGENGSVQGFLEVMGIPYTGSAGAGICCRYGQRDIEENMFVSWNPSASI